MSEPPPVFSVSEITGAIQRTLADAFGRVSVRGEISNFRPAASGHLYFALKDRDAQLRTVMFRGAAIGLRFLPADGVEVIADGEISIYQPRGDLQLIVRTMMPAGLGALMQAFEALKRRLAAEGLFDAERKVPLPSYPMTVGIITSPTGAAVRDLLHVLGRRWPMARIVFIPVRVQGEGSAEEIAAALRKMDAWGGADVIIVGRGGGSLEDLWAFNEEPVARAIAACTTPVISAVGHETDFTIADLVADLRAPTPSAAAEVAVPDRREVARRFAHLGEKLDRHMARALQERRMTLQRLVSAYGLRRPEEFLRREQQRVDGLASRLTAATSWATEGRRRRIQEAARVLGALDPTAVLGRGYCLARDPATGRVLTGAKGLASGAPLVVQFRSDRAHARVERVEAGGPRELEGTPGGER
jgi:exodeoxyribonuclease VII large subunit